MELVSRGAFRRCHFAKAPLDQSGERLDRFVGALAAGTQSQCRTVSCAQRQQVQDALAVNYLVSFDNFDNARESRRELDELVRRAGVESLRIHDDYRACYASFHVPKTFPRVKSKPSN